MKLHLGVIDVPYTDGPQTTGDVAEILEEKYGVMGFFYELHGNQVADALADSLEGAMENLMAGAPVGSVNPFRSAESNIETMFRLFLDAKEMDGKASGVPTGAALMGKSKRLKRTHGEPRPSFVDSGLYQTSFKCWVET
jgi:hypothetical protein